MKQLQQVILGIVSLGIGFIFLFYYKKFLRMAIESQKDVDRVLRRKSDYSGAGFNLVPKIIIILIGIGFCIAGIFSILSTFF